MQHMTKSRYLQLTLSVGPRQPTLLKKRLQETTLVKKLPYICMGLKLFIHLLLDLCIIYKTQYTVYEVTVIFLTVFWLAYLKSEYCYRIDLLLLTAILSPPITVQYCLQYCPVKKKFHHLEHCTTSKLQTQKNAVKANNLLFAIISVFPKVTKHTKAP
jgi:hypothetical protein